MHAVEKKYQNKKIAIVGFAREGQSLYRYLTKKGLKNITILDKNQNSNLPPKISAQIGDKYLENLKNYDFIFKSPGIPIEELLKNSARLANITSSTNLFFEMARGKIIGITGTKGKGTTSTLVFNILKTWRTKNVFLAGNIGLPMLELLKKLNSQSISIIELSSFQLESMRQSPNLAVVLNIFEDHLDRHKNMKNYLKSKANIGLYQKKDGIIIFDKDNKYSQKIALQSPSLKKYSFSQHDLKSSAYLDDKKIKAYIGGKRFEMDISNLAISGRHNIKNIMAGILTALSMDCPPEIIIKEIKKFKGLEYRLQDIGVKNGIQIINDSASTNPGATIAALRAIPNPKILILGGVNKGFHLKSLVAEIARQNVKYTALIGSSASEIKKLFLGLKKLPDFGVFQNLKQALKKCLATAKKDDVVLFSPGAASFDMFVDYKDRGIAFNKLVRDILNN